MRMKLEGREFDRPDVALYDTKRIIYCPHCGDLKPVWENWPLPSEYIEHEPGYVHEVNIKVLEVICCACRGEIHIPANGAGIHVGFVCSKTKYRS